MSISQAESPGRNITVVLLILAFFVLAYVFLEYNEMYISAVGSGSSSSTTGSSIFRGNKNNCNNVCHTRLDQRLELFNGRDILNRQDLKKQIMDAKERLIDTIKVDYGEYFDQIFTKQPNNKEFFVPNVPVGDESMELFKRKLMIKILSAQKNLRDEENNIGGCNCAAADNKRRSLQQDNAEGNGSPSDAVLIEPTFAKYIWATGGHSAAAGHGNLFNESYTAFLERDVQDVFQSIGIDFEARNYAMGGTPSGPEIAMCFEEIFGKDLDFFVYDYGMTDAGRDRRVIYYLYRGSISNGRPAFLAFVNEHIARSQVEPLANIGIPAFVADSKLTSEMRSSFPETNGMTQKQIDALPEYARNVMCNGGIEKGEPFCEKEKYTRGVCNERPGQVSWVSFLNFFWYLAF
jgi:hypothetical protein